MTVSLTVLYHGTILLFIKMTKCISPTAIPTLTATLKTFSSKWKATLICEIFAKDRPSAKL